MAFILKNLNPVGGQSRPGKTATAGSGPLGPIAMWSYFHPTDAKAAVKAAGYFNQARNLLAPGDAITFSANGAAVVIITVATVPKTGNVTIQTAEIASA